MISAVLMVAACAVEQSVPESEVLPQGSQTDTLPPGAIQTTDNTYMVPLSQRDGDGCLAYRVYAPGKKTVQALYYRALDGHFTANRLEAACKAS